MTDDRTDAYLDDLARDFVRGLDDGDRRRLWRLLHSVDREMPERPQIVMLETIAELARTAKLRRKRRRVHVDEVSSSCACCICRGLEHAALVDVAELAGIADALSGATDLSARFRPSDVIMLQRLALLSGAVALRHALGLEVVPFDVEPGVH